MRIVYDVEEANPLPQAATERGILALAAGCGVEIGADDTVIIREHTELPGGYYPIAIGASADGSRACFVDYGAIRRAIINLTDAELRGAGIDPEAGAFEVQAMRLLRRRFAHWSEAQLTEMISILPLLRVIAHEFGDPEDRER
jgi:hypothetical protein